jgi:hypothetical protein
MIYLLVVPERERKTRMMMEALAAGLGDEPHRIIKGEPPDDNSPFVIWGQEWLALRVIPLGARRRRPFFWLDNGFWNPARGTDRGYYRITYRGPSPILLRDEGLRRPTITTKPWREDGKHVVFAMPGIHFGMALGLDVAGWCDRALWHVHEECERIGRELRVRPRDAKRPLADDLRDCWALVTHSSNVAVDAAIAGVPVFVQPSSPAAPVGRLDCDLAHPVRPRREHWLRSLASQHFDLNEMQNGTAWKWMQRIAAEVDGCSSGH